MEAKKISFGFSKITKKPNLLPSKGNAKEEPKVELIKCLEGQEIKLVEEKPEEKPLIIPLKESHKTSAALASLMKRRAVLLGEEEPEENTKPTEDAIATTNGDTEENIEKRAARELLAEIQKNSNGTDTGNNLVLPIVKPEDLPLDGAKESTLDDYDSIPIQDFGKAMLRGMGWTEPPAKKNKNGIIDDMPVVRPKGMGLGADKALKKTPLLVAPEANEVLEVERNAYVRILGGKHKDLYGQIEGFDDHAGRVIVKMAIGGAKEAFNEFLCQPVSRKEYSQYGKCINTTKYEEYKKKENEYGQIILSKDERDQLKVKEEKKMKKEYDIKAEDDSKYQKNYKDYESKSKYEDQQRDGENRLKDKECDRRRDRDDGGDPKRETKRSEESKRNDDRREYKRDNEDGKDYRRDYRKDEDRREYKGKDYDRDYVGDHKKDEEKKDYRKDYRRDDKDGRDDNRKDKRDESRSYKKDYDRYDTKSSRKYDDEDKYYYKDSRTDDRSSRNDYERNYYKTNKDCERSSTRDKERQKERDRDRHKVIEINTDSETNSDDSTSKHHKSKKSKKRSKKSKKNKTKYKSDTSSSSDSETSSSDSESDERHKKHKKKSKKSKKQRERSRSRGRR